MKLSVREVRENNNQSQYSGSKRGNISNHGANMSVAQLHPVVRQKQLQQSRHKWPITIISTIMMNLAKKAVLAKSPPRPDQHNFWRVLQVSLQASIFVDCAGYLKRTTSPKGFGASDISLSCCSSYPHRCLPSLAITLPLTASSRPQSPSMTPWMQPRSPRVSPSFWSQFPRFNVWCASCDFDKTNEHKVSTILWQRDILSSSDKAISSSSDRATSSSLLSMSLTQRWQTLCRHVQAPASLR